MQYLPQALALAVVLEFAPITAGLIVAGRSGASLGAELGSMRLTEQIDALEVLGLPPLRELVAPRVLACMVALPLLTVFIAYLVAGAGYLCELLGGNMSLAAVHHEIAASADLRDSVTAVLKTVLFGFLIGVTGCLLRHDGAGRHRGRRQRGDARRGGVDLPGAGVERGAGAADPAGGRANRIRCGGRYPPQWPARPGRAAGGQSLRLPRAAGQVAASHAPAAVGWG